ncbi:MAG: hypothetical protein IJ154_04250 [Bacteroidales bacterium]|nr:hypothetical protein [Bacteroidales bacterium]
MAVLKTDKKRVLERVILTLLLTAVIAVLFYKKWQPLAPTADIPVTFTVDSPHGLDVEVFWTESNNQIFHPDRESALHSQPGSHQLTFMIPAGVLHKLRIDIGYRPGRVSLHNLTINGKDSPQQNWKLLRSNDIDSLQILSEGIELYSNKEDPFVVFEEAFDIRANHQAPSGDFWTLIMIIVPLAFFLFWKLLGFMIRQSAQVDNLLFLLLFLWLICTPASSINKGKINTSENRRLAAFPKWQEGDHINRHFGKDFETWFNDRFFLRQQLVEADNKIIRHVNRHLQNQHILVGREQWAFAKGDDGISNYQNHTTFSEEDLQTIADYLQSIDNWCRARSKHFYFVIAPDKSKIYGEFYPGYIKKTKPDEESRTYALLEYLHNHTSVKTFYPRSELLAGKKDGKLLYYKNDIHWTQAGAYIAYQLIRKEMDRELDLPALSVKAWEPYQFHYGDANILFPKAMAADTLTTYYRPGEAASYTLTEEIKGDPHNQYYYNSTGKHRALFMRDSFSNLLLECYFANVFERITARWRYDMTSEDYQYILDNEIDIVVLEVLERLLPKLINTINK